jgi:uncharacterized protein YwqG
VILACAKPAVAITIVPCEEHDLPPGATKFGGLPSLPVGTEWPRCAAGPLEFLAQFDLAELRRTVVGQRLPPTGLLSFFMYHNSSEDMYGAHDNGVPGGLQIRHTPAGTKLGVLAPPDDLDENLGRPRSPGELQFVDALDLPDYHERYSEIEIFERPPRLNDASHQLFGYAHVTVLVQDPIPGPEWEQLIRFDSDDNFGWNWGDGHRMFWYIKTADLRAGRFDDTVAIDG